MTPAERAALLTERHGAVYRDVVRRMGRDGWLGVGWPTEWGGRGFTPVEQFIWFDESMRAGAPVPMLTISTVGPTIMRFGTDEQKAFFLPKILKGEIHFCIGYSEPGAGTDLAALTTKAERDGEGMLRYLDGKVARWWLPDDVVFVDELPHTATGKVSKKTLRERFQ